ncbi:hypothetical protein L207DRAFT_573678 [Hyaloscypha variabilis F]|uniref:Uncharacterized protein n=1 Tax=Hyaloscypha variabilis (strain UAMH 11265 / GT02V1 / F) TaxID=1149755 RepID=A0A2J6QVD8_HYAVF|nr:hypothetical protein L207DRAFT_573678 [Hyaloscypha variabilis F]
MELFPKTRTSRPPAKRRSSNNGSRSSSYSGSSCSSDTYSSNTYSGKNYVVNNLNTGNYCPKDRYSGSGYTVNNGNFPRNDNSRREYPGSIYSTGRRLSTAANTSTISKMDKFLTRGERAADELRHFGELFGEIPRLQAAGSIMKIGGASAKAIIVVCQKCKKKFQDWREARHRKNCNYEYCNRCG